MDVLTTLANVAAKRDPLVYTFGKESIGVANMDNTLQWSGSRQVWAQAVKQAEQRLEADALITARVKAARSHAKYMRQWAFEYAMGLQGGDEDYCEHWAEVHEKAAQESDAIADEIELLRTK